jgi:hypothetical protein
MLGKKLFVLFFNLLLVAVSFSQEMSGPILITEFMAKNNEILIDQDREFHDWIELYNSSNTAIQLHGWHLTDRDSDLQQWTFSDGVIEPNGYLLVYASGKDIHDSTASHTNFSLSSDGEFLAVVKPDGTISHSYSPAYPNQDVSHQGFSYGIDEQMQERFFLNPTPLAPNAEGYIDFLNSPMFSHERGFYEEPFQLILTSNITDAEIFYTTDGSLPTQENGVRYTFPLSISSTSIIRAVAYEADYAPSVSMTHTYIFLEDVIHQQRTSNLPLRWGNNVLADYEMDPDIVGHPDYADTIIDDLKSIPTVSIVMDSDELFGQPNGIYVNPEDKGIAWERASSTEWIYADDRDSFQINNGIRIQGGYSRIPDRRKHSFRLLFKQDYGPPKLRHDVFPNTPINEFDTITLRGNYNYTWHAGEGGFNSNVAKADYIRDEFARRTQLDAGQPAVHGTYAHLYLNGMYWGVYNVVERPDDSFAESYFGETKEDYDVVTGGSRGVSTTQVKAGTKRAWLELMSIANRGNFQIQENYEAIQEYVDIENLIDYMLVICYTGNRDAPTVIGGGGTPWNFYTTRLRQTGAGLKTYVWDSEWCLEELGHNVVDFHRGRDNPALIFQQLRANSDFLAFVADRIQKHFFDDGAMTAEASIARYTAIKETIDRAIVGESARWGDTRSSNPKTRNEDWIGEVNRLLTTYFPFRTKVVLDQLRETGLFPTIDAPQFNHSSGYIEPGLELTMLSQTIPEEVTPFINMTDEWKYNQSEEFQTDWKNTDFDDSDWPSGKALLYVENSSLPASKNTSLTLGRTTYYFRKEFYIDPTLDLSHTTFDITTIIDDGAVIYVNGEELFRLRMDSGSVRYQTYASSTVSNAAIEGPFTYPGSLFQHGENTIAVEVHQTNSSSSDVVFGLELSSDTILANDPINLPIYYTRDGSDPRLPGGDINSDASLFQQPIPISENTFLRARAFSNGSWSAINEVHLTIHEQVDSYDDIKDNLRITELMYDPSGGGEYEFIELYNNHSSYALQLDGLSFNEGIQYTFPLNTILLPNDYLLLTKTGSPTEIANFKEYYRLDDEVVIVGPYSGQLANEGERITLSSNENDIVSFEYRDSRGWHIQADGAGHSLVPLQSVIDELDQSILNYGHNWRPSFAIDGSPGREDQEPILTVRINEFMASTDWDNSDNPDYQSNDWIELYNTSSEPIDLSHWYLSDDKDELQKWAIPTNTISEFDYISFDEITGFHNPLEIGFGLSNDGEQIFLSYLPGVIGQDRVVDAVEFKAQEKDVSLGRYIDGDDYWYRTLPTRDQSNQSLPIPVVIDEIMYAPPFETDNPDEQFLYEYIELWNQSGESVLLGDPDKPYRIDGGIDYVFHSQTTLSADERLVLVSFDPNDETIKNQFLTFYEIAENAVTLYGPFEGKISNQGERIALEKARSIDAAGQPLNWIIMDEAIYFSNTPWISSPKHTGLSLQRIVPDMAGNNPFNWKGVEPTPGYGDDINTKLYEWNIY